MYDPRRRTCGGALTQETFFKALKSFGGFDGKKDVRAWLFTIAKNTYYTYLKRRRIYSGEAPDGTVPDCGAHFVDRLIDGERSFQIHRYLHSMPEPYKEVFTLRIFGELPFEKTGGLFGKSADRARVTFYRAKVRIMEYMEAMDNGKDQL